MATATHSHANEGYAARAHPEFVAIDIGEECGALILHTDPGMHGVEVEISAAGADRTGRHNQVLERSINGEPAFTAVFDRIAEGSYTLWVDDEPRARGVEVRAGKVAEMDWRS